MIGPDFAEEYLRTHGLVHYGRYLALKEFLDGIGEFPTDFAPDVTHPEVAAALAGADQLIVRRREAVAMRRSATKEHRNNRAHNTCERFMYTL